MTASARLRELGIDLPPVPAPAGLYVPATRVGDLVYTSGQLPTVDGALTFTGLVGRDVSIDNAAAAARVAAINAVAAAAAAADGIDNVVRVIKLTGFVACTADFTAQPQVINGASGLLGEIFGDAGVHARAAVGVAALPAGAPVEVEMVVQVA